MGCIGRKDVTSLTFQLRHEWRKGATWRRAFQVEEPVGLREESSRFVLSMEGWLLHLCEVARGMKLEKDTGRIYSTCALDKEFYSEVFLLFSGWVFGNGAWRVSECCEIRDTTWTPASACQKRGSQSGEPVLKPEAKEGPQWLPTPPVKKLLEQKVWLPCSGRS